MKLSNHDLQKFLLASPLTNTQFRVAMAILQFRNNKTGRCHPKQCTIAKLLNTTERHVRKTIHELRERNCLIAIQPAPHRALHYFFAYDFVNLKNASNGNYPELTAADKKYSDALIK